MKIFNSDGLRGCAIGQLEGQISVLKSLIVHATSLRDTYKYVKNEEKTKEYEERVLNLEFSLLAIETLVETLKNEDRKI